ncbi:hypothetical protein ACIGKR_23905 [Rhodococcus qingshengii]|uniref:DUF7426 family protein n=1 Tax=Rhodococcus qingshengii TaxID=334542 RepID=UPI0037CA41DD
MRNLREFYDPSLKLTVGDKTYTIPAPNITEGGRLKALFSNPQASFTDDDQLAEVAKMLGATWVPNVVDSVVLDPITEQPTIGEDGEPVTIKIDQGHYAGGLWSEMDADGLTWPELVHVGTTALIYFGQSTTLGEIYYETALGGIEGSSLPEEQKRAPTKKAAPRPRSSKPAVRKAAKKSAPKKATPATA